MCLFSNKDLYEQQGWFVYELRNDVSKPQRIEVRIEVYATGINISRVGTPQDISLTQ